jgi:hypothetical protein
MYIGVIGFKISGCDIRHQLCAERVVIAVGQGVPTATWMSKSPQPFPAAIVGVI